MDRKNLKFPKINFKGMCHPTVIRKAMKEPWQESLEQQPAHHEIYQKLMSSYDESREKHLKQREEKPQRVPSVTTYYKNKQEKLADERYVTPKFSVKHQSDVEMEDFLLSRDAKLYAAMPKKLVVTIDLPLLKSADDAKLDVQEQSLTLRSEKPAKYLLELALPYPVDGDNGNAKFDTKYKKLTVTLPVVRSATQESDTCETNSRSDSDQNSPASSKDDEEELSSDKVALVKECGSACENAESNRVSGMADECDDTALRTSDATESDAFMISSIKYNLPAYACNIYNNQLAVTVNVKNVDSDAIRHRILDNNAGIHILLTSVGAGFFPQYYSLCLKLGDGLVKPETLTIEPWDNNVVFSVTVEDIQNVAQYFVGVDTEFMESKDLPTTASFTNKFKELMVRHRAYYIIRNNLEQLRFF